MAQHSPDSPALGSRGSKDGSLLAGLSWTTVPKQPAVLDGLSSAREKLSHLGKILGEKKRKGVVTPVSQMASQPLAHICGVQ